MLPDAHSVSGAVRDLGPSHAPVVPRLLGDEVRGVVARRGRLPHAEAGARGTVRISLLGAQAVIAQMPQLAGQSPLDAEGGNRGRVRLARIVGGQAYARGRVDRIAQGDPAPGRRSEFIDVGDRDAPFGGVDGDVDAPRIATGRRPPRPVEAVARAAVVVGQRPERRDSGWAQHVLPAAFRPRDDPALGS